jgi:outer membrane protein assembly factor BamB
MGLWAGSAGGADWPQFLGPARNGIVSLAPPVKPWGPEGPKVLWTRAIGQGYSGPVVFGDRLVLFHRQGDDEVIECLEDRTGRSRWVARYACSYRDDYGKGDGPRATPTIAGGRVFTLGAGGHLQATNLEDGKVVWKHDLSTAYDFRKGFFGAASSPLVEGDLIVVNLGARKAGIVAFDKETGKEAWRAGDDEASYSSPIAATVRGDRRLFVVTRNTLTALDPRSGAVRFSSPWTSRIRASVHAATPVVVEDRLFLSSSYNTGAALFRIRAGGADVVWRGDEQLSCHYNTAIHHDGFLYGCDGRQESGVSLRCVEWMTGKIRWTQEGFGCASIICLGDTLVCLNEQGRLVLVSATAEAYRESANARVFDTTCRAEIAYAQGRLYARSDTKLSCFELGE